MTGAHATPGGIAVENRHILSVLSELARERRFDVAVLSFLEKDSDRPPALPETTFFRGFRGSKLALALAELRYALARPVFIFDHVTLATPLLPLVFGRMARIVIFAHGSESWKRIRPTSRKLFEHAILVLTNSRFTLKKMQERISRFIGVDCPLGLAPEFQLNASLPERSYRILSFPNVEGIIRQLGTQVCLLIGRMHPREREKGHYELLSIWPEILREFPDAQLVFAGPGEDAENVAQAARQVGVGSAVFVLGALGNEILMDLYAKCFAFTMPSRQEGFGLVYLEAMNFAKPCLGCRDDGAEDVIVHEQTGLLVRDPGNQEELAEAVARLLRDPAASGEMGRRGFERLHSQFTARHVQERLREQFENLI